MAGAQQCLSQPSDWSHEEGMTGMGREKAQNDDEDALHLA